MKNMRKLSSRRNFLKSSSLFLTAVMSGGLSAMNQKRTSKPNIIVILTDDQGYGDLSCYGAKDLRTPNLDKLMASGMRFDNFYANCPVCSPTRASVLTGRYPDIVGVPGVIRTMSENSWGYLSPDAVTLPSVLKKAGYHTAAIGKWHLGLVEESQPTRRGFDHFKGFLGDMMEDYYHHRRHGNNYMRAGEKEIDPKGHATDLFTDWAIDYIKSRKDERDPYFLYLAYNAPHTPIQPPEDWFKKVMKREKGIDEKRAKLVALIEHLDAGIGRVISAIKETGTVENTLVIFTSDNGGQVNVGACNGDLNGGKQDMFEGGIRVPACAVWSGKIEAGARSDYVGMTMDIFPTVCRAAGAKFSHEIDGREYLSELLGQEQNRDERFLFWVRREGGPRGGQAYYAARYGKWKILQNSPFEPLKLYDLEADPREQKPLSEKHPAYNKLFNALRNHIIRAGAVPWRKKPVELEPDVWGD